MPVAGAVTGTDADLRRLTMGGAAAILRKLGMEDEEST
jgi:hypothetical protein